MALRLAREIFSHILLFSYDICTGVQVFELRIRTYIFCFRRFHRKCEYNRKTLDFQATLFFNQFCIDFEKLKLGTYIYTIITTERNCNAAFWLMNRFIIFASSCTTLPFFCIMHCVSRLSLKWPIHFQPLSFLVAKLEFYSFCWQITSLRLYSKCSFEKSFWKFHFAVFYFNGTNWILSFQPVKLYTSSRIPT